MQSFNSDITDNKKVVKEISVLLYLEIQGFKMPVAVSEHLQEKVVSCHFVFQSLRLETNFLKIQEIHHTFLELLAHLGNNTPVWLLESIHKLDERVLQYLLLA